VSEHGCAASEQCKATTERLHWAAQKKPEPIPQSQYLIRQECDDIKALLLEKNRRYGDSALSPVRVFSKSDTIEQIKVRIDDKLSRIISGQDDDTEDAVVDLIGYLILLRIAIQQDKAGEVTQ
jgi:hypothetical protein